MRDIIRGEEPRKTCYLCKGEVGFDGGEMLYSEELEFEVCKCEDRSVMYPSIDQIENRM